MRPEIHILLLVLIVILALIVAYLGACLGACCAASAGEFARVGGNASHYSDLHGALQNYIQRADVSQHIDQGGHPLSADSYTSAHGGETGGVTGGKTDGVTGGVTGGVTSIEPEISKKSPEKLKSSVHWAVDEVESEDHQIIVSKLETRRAPAKKRRRAKMPWQSYNTWEELKRDAGASADYFDTRTAAINNPNLDWSRVVKAVMPLLDEPREHVGVVGVEADGLTLKIIASEASPEEAGSGASSTYFAGVPADLVAKYAERPALFFFHTHPADVRASPLPSSPDIATAIYFGATARFAASVVISRYGVLVYGLGWGGYKAINGARNWKLALLNFTHDVVAAHESVRSWDAYTLADYSQFFPRYRMTFYAHPTPEMVADGVRAKHMHNVESEIDHDLIGEYSTDIARQLSKRRHRTAAPLTPFMHRYDHQLTLD